MGRLAVILTLALLAQTSGCVKKTVNEILNKETRASLTVAGTDAEILARVERELNRAYDVKATVETMEKGVTIIRIIGAYAKVLKAIEMLLIHSLKLVANDEVSETLLAIAVSALK